MAPDRATIALFLVLSALAAPGCALLEWPAAPRPGVVAGPGAIGDPPAQAPASASPLVGPAPDFGPAPAGRVPIGLAAGEPSQGTADPSVVLTQSTPSPGPGGSPTSAGSTTANAANPPQGDQGGAGEGPATPRAVSGNPGATNIVTGTGWLGKVLGLEGTGIRLGGLTIADANGNLSGGLGPGKWTGDNLTIVDLSIDLEERYGWKGGLVGTQFLYFTSGGPGYSIDGVVQGRGDLNALTGSLLGPNSLVGPPPLSRAELYELWYRQALFEDRFTFRIGKSVPTYDFNNVVRAVPLGDQVTNIPAISSLLYTPLYVNPTLLGIIPGYYNSATGLVTSWIPNEHVYFQYGFFDGNLARGRQTGQEGPHFNGYWLHLTEAGASWLLGPNKKPGKFGVGAWFQTGQFTSFTGKPFAGAQGIYLFGSQRLYYENREQNNHGLSAFYQFGATNTDLVLIHRYFGAGLTYFGPIPGRGDDSCGFGTAYGTTNGDPEAGSVLFTLPPGTSLRTNRLGRDEILLSWYYQMKVRNGIFLQPNLTEVVDPARHPGIPNAFVFTIRFLALF